MVVVDMPLSILISIASKPSLLDIAKVHNAGRISARSSKDDLVKQLKYHDCTDCPCVYYFFRAVNQINSNKQRQKAWRDKNKIKTTTAKSELSFPPRPPCSEHIADIIRDFSNSVDPKSHIESACAVCGSLVSKSQLQNLEDVQFNQDILISE